MGPNFLPSHNFAFRVEKESKYFVEVSDNDFTLEKN